MRRAVQALIISGALLSAAACGTATGSTPGAAVDAGTAPPRTPTTQTTEIASTRSLCDALGQVYNKNMAPLAEALTNLVSAGGGQNNQNNQKQVQQSMKAFAGAIRGATQRSTDPQVRTEGDKAADQLQAKAADATFLSTIKTTEDVNKVLGPTLKEWLSPVAHHCS